MTPTPTLLVFRPRETPHPHPIAIYTSPKYAAMRFRSVVSPAILPSNIKSLDVDRSVIDRVTTFIILRFLFLQMITRRIFLRNFYTFLNYICYICR